MANLVHQMPAKEWPPLTPPIVTGQEKLTHPGEILPCFIFCYRWVTSIILRPKICHILRCQWSFPAPFNVLTIVTEFLGHWLFLNRTVTREGKAYTDHGPR